MLPVIFCAEAAGVPVITSNRPHSGGLPVTKYTIYKHQDTATEKAPRGLDESSVRTVFQ